MRIYEISQICFRGRHIAQKICMILLPSYIVAVGSKYSWQNRERYFSPLGPPHLSSFTQTNISPLTKIYISDLTERIFCICFKIISLLPPLRWDGARISEPLRPNLSKSTELEANKKMMFCLNILRVLHGPSCGEIVSPHWVYDGLLCHTIQTFRGHSGLKCPIWLHLYITVVIAL